MTKSWWKFMMPFQDNSSCSNEIFIEILLFQLDNLKLLRLLSTQKSRKSYKVLQQTFYYPSVNLVILRIWIYQSTFFLRVPLILIYNKLMDLFALLCVLLLYMKNCHLLSVIQGFFLSMTSCNFMHAIVRFSLPK